MKLHTLWGIVLVVALIALSPIVGFSAPANAGNVKAAYVNMQKVLESDSSYQAAIQDLQQYRQELRKKIQQKRREIRKMSKKLKQQGSLLSQQQRRQKQQQIRRQMRSLQQRARQSQLQLQRKKQELLAPVLEKIDPVVREVAEENGYNVIYSYGRSKNPSVLWVDDSINITNQIIKRLESLSSE